MKQKEVMVVLVQQVFKNIFFTIFLFIVILNYSYSKNKINNELLNEVEVYLNNIKYFKANFIQDDIINSYLSEGEFYLLRPGKLRIDYKNPFQATLYSDLRSTIYYDKELDEVSSVRTASTPLYFLIKKNLSFKNNSFSIVDFQEDNKYVSISFKEKGKEDQGTLILKFKKSPIILSSIKLINDKTQEIEMILSNISTKKIENSVFIFKK